MNPKRRTGYGVYDISRQIARRLQQEWEMVERPATTTRPIAVVIPFPRPGDTWPPKDRRPMAA
jgi:hypothetical protein